MTRERELLPISYLRRYGERYREAWRIAALTAALGFWFGKSFPTK
jgi:hypothetical protein